MNKSQSPESVHEEADSRTGGPDHLSQRLLTDLGDDRLGFAFLAKMSEQEQNPSQSFFTRIKELIDQATNMSENACARCRAFIIAF